MCNYLHWLQGRFIRKGSGEMMAGPFHKKGKRRDNDGLLCAVNAAADEAFCGDHMYVTRDQWLSLL